MKGSITRRGKSSWRLKYEGGRDPATGKRRINYITVRGKRAEAERELRAVLFRLDRGVSIDPTKISVSEFLDTWLADVAPQTVAPKALERYEGITRNQIKPHLGHLQLQKMRPADISGWLQAMIKA